MYRYYLYAYIVISLISTLSIVRIVKPKHAIISSVITYWFFIIPIVRSRVFRAINPFAAITGQTWRLDWQLALFLTGLLFMRFLTNKKGKLLYSKKFLQYEKYLYFYLYGSLTVILIHGILGNIAPEFLNITFFIYYQAILLFFVFIRFIDLGTIKCVLHSIVYMSVISSVICPVQFFVDTFFMRTDRIPKAFDVYQRATGLFQTPHDHALFVIMGIFIVVFSYKNQFIKFSLISLFSLGILLTYSRGSWMATLAITVVYLYTINRPVFKKAVLACAGLFILFFMFSGAYSPDMSALENNKMVEERLMSDTATPRMEYNYIVFMTILDRWMFGYGSKQNNETYYKFMFEAGGKDWAMGRAGGIHNLLLEELFLKGTFTTVFLLLFFVNLFLFSYKLGMKNRNYLILIVFYYNLAFLLYMMTASAFLSSYVGIMVVFTTAILSSVYYNNIDISEFTFEYPETHKQLLKIS